MLLAVLLGVPAIALILIVVVSAFLHAAERRTTVSPVALPTETASAAPSQEPYSPSQEPDTAEPTGERPTSRPTESRPSTAPTVNRSLKNNSLYLAGSLPATKCPGGNASIYSHAQLKALFLKTARCMGRAWSPALARVGFHWSPPGYVIAQGRGRGACGDYPPRGSNVPYYCPSNRTIYASTSAMVREYGSLGSWNGIMVSLMAHEYGHHVQHLTGISSAWWEQTLRSRSQSARMALSRRHELQATCFAGLFMRSVAASYPIPPARRNQLLGAYSYLGDAPSGPRDHGSTRNNAAWFRQGFMRPKTYQCNTWVMAAQYVS